MWVGWWDEWVRSRNIKNRLISNNISFQRFLDDTNAGEEFLYFFGPFGWKAFSVTPVYDSNDDFINNDIQSVEIPDDDEVAVA